MSITQGITTVEGIEEKEGTYVKKTGRFMLFFKTEWWEKVSERHIGNTIHIITNRKIRQVYLNEEPILTQLIKKRDEDKTTTKRLFP